MNKRNRKLEWVEIKRKRKNPLYRSDEKARKLKATKKYFKNNKDRIYKTLFLKKAEHKTKLITLFGNKCKDCKKSYPAVCYDFHHIKEPKKFNLAARLNCTWDFLLKEAKKCVMLCSNCHRLRHYKNGGLNKNIKL